MKNTDAEWDKQPTGNPCGERVTQPTPSKPEWTPKSGSPGVEQNAKGELRTNIPANDAAKPWNPWPYGFFLPEGW